MQLVTSVYLESKDFPKEEIYGLTAQIRRAAISIPSNISEGFGRKGKNDYLKFLNIAMSSLFELQTQLEISKNLLFISEKTFDNLFQDSREIERMLSSYINKIKDS